MPRPEYVEAPLPPLPPLRLRESRPPMAAVLTGVVAIISAIPAAFAAAIGVALQAGVLVAVVRLPWTWGDPGEVAQLAVVLEGALLAVGYFSLLGTAIVRLLAHRDRLLLLVTGLPLTLVIGVVVSLTNGWSALILLGPVAAALIALCPSVGSWVSVRGRG
jgi:hypothetical protein